MRLRIPLDRFYVDSSNTFGSLFHISHSHLIFLLSAKRQVRVVLKLRWIRWRRRICAKQSTLKVVIAERRRKNHVTANKRDRNTLGGAGRSNRACDNFRDALGWSRRLRKGPLHHFLCSGLWCQKWDYRAIIVLTASRGAVTLEHLKHMFLKDLMR